MIPLLKFYFHEEVRQAAVQAVPELLKSVFMAVSEGKANGADMQYVKQMLDYVWQPLIDSMVKVISLNIRISCVPQGAAPTSIMQYGRCTDDTRLYSTVQSANSVSARSVTHIAARFRGVGQHVRGCKGHCLTLWPCPAGHKQANSTSARDLVCAGARFGGVGQHVRGCSGHREAGRPSPADYGPASTGLRALQGHSGRQR